MARSLGMPDNNIFVLEDGDVLELTEKSGKVAEKVSAGPVYVNGLSVGDIGSVILRDRKLLAQDGIVIAIVAMDKRDGSLVGRPDIVSRGFVDEKESPELLEQSRDLLAQALSRGGPHVAEWTYVSGKVKDTLSRFFYEQTKRRPMILPVLIEV